MMNNDLIKNIFLELGDLLLTNLKSIMEIVFAGWLRIAWMVFGIVLVLTFFYGAEPIPQYAAIPKLILECKNNCRYLSVFFFSYLVWVSAFVAWALQAKERYEATIASYVLISAGVLVSLWLELPLYIVLILLVVQVGALFAKGFPEYGKTAITAITFNLIILTAMALIAIP